LLARAQRLLPLALMQSSVNSVVETLTKPDDAPIEMIRRQRILNIEKITGAAVVLLRLIPQFPQECRLPHEILSTDSSPS
jgi:hypothetical protein